MNQTNSFLDKSNTRMYPLRKINDPIKQWEINLLTANEKKMINFLYFFPSFLNKIKQPKPEWKIFNNASPMQLLTYRIH